MKVAGLACLFVLVIVAVVQQTASDPDLPNETDGDATAANSGLFSPVAGTGPHEQSVADWIAARKSKLTINQERNASNPWYRGSIELNGLRADLGETPSVIEYHLDTAHCPILLGWFHLHRHNLVRTICPVVITDDGIELGGGATVILSRSCPYLGVAFYRDQNPIIDIGIIIPTPDPDAPPLKPGLKTYDAEVRVVGGDDMFVSLENLPLEPLDDKIVLMGDDRITPISPTPKKLPGSARIVWLRTTEDGRLILRDDAP